MRVLKVYRTPIAGFDWSLFDPTKNPRLNREKEYLYLEEVTDSENRPISIVRFDRHGEQIYRKSYRYDGNRIREEEEESHEYAGPITRRHSYEKNRETITVLFDGEVDEVIVREHRDDGSLASEVSADAAGEARNATEWDEAGRITYTETPTFAESYTYDAEGRTVEHAVETDGVQVIETRTRIHDNTEEFDVTESDALVGKRIVEREPNRIRSTETRGDRVISSREETLDHEGRTTVAQESTVDDAGRSGQSTTRMVYYPDGKLRMVQRSQQGQLLQDRLRSMATSGFREYIYDGDGRLLETLLCNFRAEELDDNSYYRYVYEA